jgi:hypothetical protein
MILTTLLRRICGSMDFFEFLAKKHGLREGGFSFLALLCLPEAAIDCDDTIRLWHLQLVVDVARPKITWYVLLK